MGMYETPARSDELYHYGVMGMHWGVRRYQNPDGTWKNAGKKRHSKQQIKSESGVTRKSDMGENTAEMKKSGIHLTDKQKKAIKIGAAVAGTALVAYGGYKVAQAIKLDKKRWEETRKLVKRYNIAKDFEERSKEYYEGMKKHENIVPPHFVNDAMSQLTRDQKLLRYANEDLSSYAKTLPKSKTPKIPKISNPYKPLSDGLNKVSNKLYKSSLKRANKKIDWDSVGPQMVSNKTGRILSEKEAEAIIERAMKKYRR